PPPYTGNFIPSTPDLSFTGLDEFVNEHVVKNSKAMSSKEDSKVVRKNDDAPIEFVKPKQQEKTARKTVKQVEKHRQNTHSLENTLEEVTTASGRVNAASEEVSTTELVSTAYVICRSTATPRGGRTGGRTGRGSGRTRGLTGDLGNGGIDEQCGHVCGQGNEVNDGVDRVPDFSTIIAQQLQNLFPTILAQVGNQRNN
ncbi:hypothetical protein Tco_1024751, partial [Tanacetum coccineum]